MTTDTDLLERTESTAPVHVDSIETAREVVEATMETLGERITDGQAADLAESLPDVAADPLENATPGEAEQFSVAEFAERVDERTDTAIDDPVGPIELARSAVTGVRDVADETELERTREQLPDEFDLVFDPGQPMTEDEFLEIVANNLDGIDVAPREAIDAVLETIADRVTGGQAGTLATYLPRELRSPLTDTDERALEFDWDEFLDRIAIRADVETDDATAMTRAVVDALYETGADRQLRNVRTQLPDEFDRHR